MHAPVTTRARRVPTRRPHHGTHRRRHRRGACSHRRHAGRRPRSPAHPPPTRVRGIRGGCRHTWTIPTVCQTQLFRYRIPIPFQGRMSATQASANPRSCHHFATVGLASGHQATPIRRRSSCDAQAGIMTWLIERRLKRLARRWCNFHLGGFDIAFLGLGIVRTGQKEENTGYHSH